MSAMTHSGHPCLAKERDKSVEREGPYDQAPAVATIETVVPSGPPDRSTIAPS